MSMLSSVCCRAWRVRVCVAVHAAVHAAHRGGREERAGAPAVVARRVATKDKAIGLVVVTAFPNAAASAGNASPAARPDVPARVGVVEVKDHRGHHVVDPPQSAAVASASGAGNITSKPCPLQRWKPDRNVAGHGVEREVPIEGRHRATRAVLRLERGPHRRRPRCHSPCTRAHVSIYFSLGKG